jgi:hypothetical protein
MDVKFKSSDIKLICKICNELPLKTFCSEKCIWNYVGSQRVMPEYRLKRHQRYEFPDNDLKQQLISDRLIICYYVNNNDLIITFPVP